MAVCLGCGVRVLGCHSSCEKYIEEVAERNILKEKKQQEKEKSMGKQMYVAECFRRNQRKSNRKYR